MPASHSLLRVWDLPTRVFHWLLAFCVFSLIITGLRGGNALEWHLKLGYAAAALLIFRLVWGVVGGYWSRFKQFLYSPLTILRYLRGQATPEHEVGHTPLGSLSVWALFILLSAQIATGLLSDDEIATQGPLVKFVSGAWVSLATGYHKHWGKWFVALLVSLHIAAILFYHFKRNENLTRPMLYGDKEYRSTSLLPASKDTALHRLAALTVFTGIALTVGYAVQRFG